MRRSHWRPGEPRAWRALAVVLLLAAWSAESLERPRCACAGGLNLECPCGAGIDVLENRGPGGCCAAVGSLTHRGPGEPALFFCWRPGEPRAWRAPAVPALAAWRAAGLECPCSPDAAPHMCASVCLGSGVFGTQSHNYTCTHPCTFELAEPAPRTATADPNTRLPESHHRHCSARWPACCAPSCIFESLHLNASGRERYV